MRNLALVFAKLIKRSSSFSTAGTAFTRLSKTGVKFTWFVDTFLKRS